MSNPLVDRILNNPLTFVSAKAPDQESSTERHPSYIVLSKTSENQKNSLNQQQQTPMLVQKKKGSEAKKPQSMAEAIAAYTGKKYMTKKEKKAQKALQKDVSEAVPQEETNIHTQSPNKMDADDAELDSSSLSRASDASEDSQYESASEFQTDSSFQGFRDTSDESEAFKSEASTTPNTDSRADSDSEKESTPGEISKTLQDTEFLDDDDGEDYDGNDVEVSSADEDSDGSEESDENDIEEDSESDEDSEGGAHSEVEEPLEKKDLDKFAAKKLQSELKADLQADVKKTTPPTSPEVDETKPKDQVQNTKSDINQTAKSVSSFLQPHYKINEPGVDRGSNGSTRIIKNWNKQYIDRRPVGLLNYGVTCYMNSAIQALLHVPAVQHYLMEVLKDKHSLKPKSVTHTLSELASKMWGLGEPQNKQKKKFVNPKKIIQRLFDINCMMSEWQQEDSHEYFMSLVSRLQEDSTPKGKKLNLSIIYDIFGGLLLQEVVCQECHTVSKTQQEFYDVSLGLNKKRRSSETEEVPSGRYAIEKSMKDFFSMETIKIDKADECSGYYCEKCKKRTVATKKSLIERSPETLMVHLKRFKFNGNSSSKVKQPILYLKYLDLTPFTITKEATQYQLVAVIVHEGRSILSGHYIAHCLQPDGSWSTYDDEYINPISEKESLSDPSAYCLVYTKLTPKTQKRTNGDNKKEDKRIKRAKLS